MQEDPYNTRPTLLQRVTQKDEQSWVDFYEIYSPLIVWLCKEKNVKDDTTCHLVVQSVMSHLASTEWQYEKNKGKFRNLILRIATLKIFEVLRELRPAGSLPVTSLAPEEVEVEWNRGENNLSESLNHALKLMTKNVDISPTHLKILNLFIEGKKAPEVQQITGLSLANIYTVKHRMLRELQQIIEAEEA